MKKNILIFNGSPRKNGNTSALLSHFKTGAEKNKASIEEIFLHTADLKFCCGCLRCNMIGRCGQSGDDWEIFVEKMENADTIVIASPIYFHHVTAQMKMFIDRFRSFVNVQITESGLIHKSTKKWGKDFVLLFTMGTPNEIDAKPALEMFDFIFSFLTPGKYPHVILGKRLAVSNQVNLPAEKLKVLYQKMKIPTELAEPDFEKNQALIKECVMLGEKLSL